MLRSDQTGDGAAETTSPRAAAAEPVEQKREEKGGGSYVAAAVLSCLGYVTVSSILIVLNRDIMKSRGFPHPMTLSGLGLAGTGLAAHVSVQMGWTQLRPECQAIQASSTWYTRVLPVALSKAATLAFSNWAYMYLNMGFIQMLKAFTPCMILVLLYAFKLEEPTKQVVASVIVICFGTAFTTSADPSANVVGLLLQVGAMLTEAVSVVLTQWFLQNAKFSVMEGAYVLAPPGALALFTTAAVVEWPRVYSSGSYLAAFQSAHLFIAAMFLGIGVNLLSYVVIQETSSLTFKIVMTLRNIGLVLVGVAVYHETVTPHEWAGYSVTLAGFGAYNHFKMAKAAKPKKPPAEADCEEPPKPRPG
eukprot:TRINITY_DN2105_c3_g1_i1.p1 TRINITY_DN2105_c3_g1~~TRINITY_DN2105_c3_g1_i1.p1  ORF type:complete len:361 (+),score=121.91 TRINITY_DN2105_c3_g1_i1:267-1349(+)